MGTVLDGNRELAGQRPKHWPMALPRIEEMMETLMALLGRKIDEYTGPLLSTKKFLACAQTLEAERDRIGGLEAKIDQSGYEAQAVHVTGMALQRNEYLLNRDRKEHTVLITTRNKGSPLKALFMHSASLDYLDFSDQALEAAQEVKHREYIRQNDSRCPERRVRTPQGIQ
jgi:hypothetical protein